MKLKILCLLITCLFFECKVKEYIVDDNLKKVKVEKIDSNSFSNFHIIYFSYKEEEGKGLIISKKSDFQLSESNKEIKIGKNYFLSLRLVKSTKKITGINQRLYEADILIGDEFIFYKNVKVYESQCITDLFYKEC